MAFRVKSDESLSFGIKRILVELADYAIDQLLVSEGDLEEPIHEARKSFKKIRAVIRLVRDAIGNSIYKRENICYRDAGRKLSDVRDSIVFIETIDKLISNFPEYISKEETADLKQRITIRHENIKRKIVYEDKAPLEVAEIVSNAKSRINDLHIDKEDFSALEGGLGRVYRRGYNALLETYRNPTPENFHDWRKRVKYLWYQVRILRPINRRKMKTYADQLKELSDLLGDEHDCTVLKELLQSEPEISKPELTYKLFDLIDIRRFQLRTDSWKLGKLVYIEEPDIFVNRIKNYWNNWAAG